MTQQCRSCRRCRFHSWIKRPPRGGHGNHSSVILSWRIAWTEEPGGLQSMGSQGVGHNWRDLVRMPTQCFLLTQLHAHHSSFKFLEHLKFFLASGFPGFTHCLWCSLSSIAHGSGLLQGVAPPNPLTYAFTVLRVIFLSKINHSFQLIHF